MSKQQKTHLRTSLAPFIIEMNEASLPALYPSTRLGPQPGGIIKIQFFFDPRSIGVDCRNAKSQLGGNFTCR
jgi:hypothetical protein